MRQRQGLEEKESDIARKYDRFHCGQQLEIMQIDDKENDQHDGRTSQRIDRPHTTISRGLQVDIKCIGDAQEHGGKENIDQARENDRRCQQNDGPIQHAESFHHHHHQLVAVEGIKIFCVAYEKRRAQCEGDILKPDSDKPADVRKDTMKDVIVGTDHPVTVYDAEKREIENGLIVLPEYIQAKKKKTSHKQAA